MENPCPRCKKNSIENVAMNGEANTIQRLMFPAEKERIRKSLKS